MGALQRQIFRTRKSIIGRLRRCAPSTAGRSPIGTGTILIASSRIVAVGGSAIGTMTILVVTTGGEVRSSPQNVRLAARPFGVEATSGSLPRILGVWMRRSSSFYAVVSRGWRLISTRDSADGWTVRTQSRMR